MNYNNSIEQLIQKIKPSKFNEEIYSILSNYENTETVISEMDEVKSVDKLKELRNRYDRSGFGSSINLYPSNYKGACHSFCLAIANKKFDKPRKGLDSGFKGIMLNLFAYWFSCLDINDTTLILTSDWDNEIFENQYKEIIDSYTQTHNKKVYIIDAGPTGFFLRYPY